MKAICNSFLVSFFKKAMLRLLILTGLLLLLSLTARGQTASGLGSQDIVATTLIFEAGGESNDHGMIAVYEVIQNRALAKNKTEIEICLARKQFSCWNGVTDIRKKVEQARKHPKWEEAVLVYLNNKRTNFTKGATFYHSKKIPPPKWAAYSHKTCEIGNHIFYK